MHLIEGPSLPPVDLRPSSYIFYLFATGHLEKLLVSDKSHVKHDKTYLFAKSLFSGLVGLDEKFEFFEVPY